MQQQAGRGNPFIGRQVQCEIHMFVLLVESLIDDGFMSITVDNASNQ